MGGLFLIEKCFTSRSQAHPPFGSSADSPDRIIGGWCRTKRKAHRSREMAAKNTKRHKEVRSRGGGATLKNSIFLHLCRSSFLRLSRSFRLSRTSNISSACICVICGQFGTEFGHLCFIGGLRSPLVAANGRAGLSALQMHTVLFSWQSFSLAVGARCRGWS